MKPQLADSLTTWRLGAELDGALAGAVVRKVLAAGATAMVVELAAKSRPVALLVNWQQGAARAHLAVEVETVRDEPGFVTAARRALTGAVVEGVRQLAFDRVLIVDLANLENFGESERGRLTIEATGREPNCLLVRGEAIAAVARPRTATEGVYRSLAPGEPYVPPPGQDRPDPRAVTVEELRDLLAAGEGDVAAALRRGLQGMSGLLVDEVLRRAVGDGGAEALLAALDEVFAEAAKGQAWLWRDDGGRPALAYPVRLGVSGPGEWEKIESLSAGLEAIGQGIEDGQERERLAAQVGRQLRNELARKKKVLAERERELRAAGEADKWRRWGELLVASMHALPKRQGSGEVEVVDYYAEGQPTVAVPLAPGKDARASAEEYFARYRRAQRAAERIPPMAERARADVEKLEAEVGRLDGTDSVAELRAMAERYGAAKKPSGAHAKAAGLGRAVAPSGHVVLYGRSAAENDEVLKAARPEDVWLHARGVHGSHVVIRSEGAPEKVPHETVLWAARLAGRRSDYRRDGVADVDYTPARYVRKPRGTPPGYVIYTHQKTLRVDLEGKEQ
jgi:predicted ribosome quality control (RQC) complex YloA/Tae2 family protein